MIPHHVYYQLAVVGLLWLCVMLHYLGPSLGGCPRINSSSFLSHDL